MKSVLKTSSHALSNGKMILFIIISIAIFILVAVVCNILTAEIPFSPAKIVIREIFLRMPLTLVLLHIYAKRFIKTYDPNIIYGKLTLLTFIKWVVIGLMLSLGAWTICYLVNIIVPFKQTLSLTMQDKLFLIIRWTAISIAAGITEEVLFRGHLFMIIRERCSKFRSMLLTSVIFGVVHIAMLNAVTPVDIVITVFGGILSGTMFSFIYTYTRVIWTAATVHIIWDIFFIGKITTTAITQADANNSLMAFKLTSHNLLLNGGNFGIEATLPCLLTYVTLSVILYMRGRELGIKTIET